MVPSKLKHLLQVLHIFLLCNGLKCSTHWIVTEGGRVQQQMDSVFVMRRPYDLVALMQQEKRADLVDSLKQELFVQKEQIDKNEDKETNLEENFYKTNPHCILAEGKQLGEFSLYTGSYVSMKDRNLDEYEWYVADEVTDKYEEPICTAFSKLDFSMFSYDHLTSVQDRKNLTMPKDQSLLAAVVDLNVPSFGHFIHQSLKVNKTSWVLYNVAAYFWRIQGQADNAVECLRRALHFVPKEYRDVCLFNLANILHIAHHSEEAAIIMHNAIDLQSNIPLYHYVLGTIYAVLADYNASLICFENALKLKPEFPEAKLLKNAVVCHSQLEKALESQHDSLQRTLGELKELQKHQEQLFYQQEKLRAEQATFSTKIEQRLQYEEQKLREALEARGAKCRHFKKNGQAVVSCSIENEISKIKSAEIHILHGIIDHQETEPNESVTEKYDTAIDSVLSISLTENVHKLSSKSEKLSEQNEPSESQYYPRKLSKEEQLERLYYQDPGWPSQDECNKTVKTYPPAEKFPTVYLSPENKGFKVHNILTTLQGLGPYSSHSLPWYPPVCDNNLQTNNSDLLAWVENIASLKDKAKLESLKIPDYDVQNSLLGYVDSSAEIAEEEIGQRIMTAIKKSLAPDWVLYSIATLYWRVQGNIMNAVMCLKNSLATTPKHLTDVPLVSLANVLFKMKEFGDAIAVMHQAFSVNNIEPLSNFFLANLYAVTGNFSGAVHHYKRALNVEPSDLKVVEYARIVTCYLKVHLKNRMNKFTQMQQSALETCEAINSKDVTKLPDISKSASCTTFCVQELDTQQIHIVESCAMGAMGLSNNKEESTHHFIRISESEFTITTETIDYIENLPDESNTSATDDQAFKSETETNKTENVKDEKARADETSQETQSQIEVMVNVGDSSAKPVNPIRAVLTPIDHARDTLIRDDSIPHILVKPFFNPSIFFAPSKHECDSILKDTNLKQLTSTWLSISAKNIVVAEHLKLTTLQSNLESGFSKHSNKLPHCSSEFPSSMLTWDHLSGVQNRMMLKGSSEIGLRDAFLSLWGDLHKPNLETAKKVLPAENNAVSFDAIMDSLGNHLAVANEKNSTSWVLTTISALYWRIKGNAVEAVNCLRYALHFAPRHMKDIPLVSLANVLHRAGLHNDAIIITNMALEISPMFVVIHFTLANIYAAKGDLMQAKAFYESTLSLQNTFEPAQERLKAILCDRNNHL